MKFKMSPARAYLLGLWKGRRTKEGVGVEGRSELCEVFLRLCLDEKLAQSDRVKYSENEESSKCFFYNTALRAFLDSELVRREERLKYKNEFAASYFAGLFDSRGGFAQGGKGEIPFLIGDRTDEIVLLRLGFRVKRERGRLALISPEFYGWVMPFVRLERSKKAATSPR